TQSSLFETLFHLVRDRLDLPWIAAAANHEVVGEGPRSFFHLQDRNFRCLLFLASADRFGNLSPDVVFLHWDWPQKPSRWLLAILMRKLLVWVSPFPANVDCQREPKVNPKPSNEHCGRREHMPNTIAHHLYSPVFLMYSATAGSTYLVNDLPVATAARIFVAETSEWTLSSKCTLTPARIRSPLAGCF